MLRLKDWVLIVGLTLIMLGGLSLPLAQRVSPKWQLSLFGQSAGHGAFVTPGTITLALGMLVIGVAFFIPRR